MARQTSGMHDARQRNRCVDVNDPLTWAITPDMTCPVEDLRPMTEEECAAAARILDDLRILRARHQTARQSRQPVARSRSRGRGRGSAGASPGTGDGSA